MQKLDIIKAATSFIVGAGTTTIVSSIVKNNTQPRNLADNVAISSAAVVIGMMAADKTKAYTNRQIDELAELTQKLRSKKN